MRFMNVRMQAREIVSDMAVFVAIVEGGSLASAARSTGLTPSAVSKLVTRLEKRFGARMLARTTRAMTVTDAGRLFYDRARIVLDELRAVEESMSSKASAPRGLVRVSAPLSFGQTRVAPILLAFLEKTPAVTLDLELTDRMVDMVGERIDVAVRITLDPPPSFVAKRVGAMRRVLCATPRYVRTRGRPEVPGDLRDHACLLHPSLQDAESFTFVSGPGAVPESVRVDGRLRVGHTLALYEAALAGLGIAELPFYLVEEDLAAKRLVRVLERYETRAPDVFVVYASGTLLPPRVRLLAQHLAKGLEETLRFSPR
jgi:DNA-binding transcriptional LysR family regulator